MPAFTLSTDQLRKIKSAGGVFITGTDTHVGKTYVSTLLLDDFNQMGISTLGLKPLSSGCEQRDGFLQNEDALQLMAKATVKLSYSEVNPIAVEEPISPHFVSPITVQALKESISLSLKKAEICLVEGVGGWLVPLNENETLADFALALNFPIILVVAMRLGCLNHALLTAAHMQARQAPTLGWIANPIDPDFRYPQKNLETLEKKLPFPLIPMQPADRISR
jgi:dethiobiotin synthetase